jgi:hypothetical protein
MIIFHLGEEVIMCEHCSTYITDDDEELYGDDAAKIQQDRYEDDIRAKLEDEKRVQKRIPKVHLVFNFDDLVGSLGKTACGIYSEHTTAYPKHATCKNCLVGTEPQEDEDE